MAFHGATGLLNELLAEQAAREETEQPEALQSTEEPKEDEEDEQVAQELRALHEEMDDCLSGLAQWRQDRERENQAIERELEAKYARQLKDFQNMDEAPDQAAESSGAEDAEPVEAPAARPRAVAAAVVSEVPRSMVAGLSSIPAAESSTEADARLAGLRAEVEALRRREAEVEKRFQNDAVVANSALDTSTNLGLTQWCLEVDAAVGSNAGAESDDLEGQLLKARGLVGKTEGALESAGCRLEAELSELERMLSECDALKARARAGA
eukprot:gb/GFBE01060973.1/.p1 GENE.gb/GFBE01060973.1/~~gb/GFBE01060973.1/.p1  ORF type:complete len:268 (+),score=76.17 gb/GFBE01060973.1/:1-804(+)